MCAAFARGVTIAGAAAAATTRPASSHRARLATAAPARRRALALGGRPTLVPSSRAVSIHGRGRAGLGALRASAAGNRSNASEELTASDEDGVVVEGVVLDDAKDGHSQHHIGHDNLDDAAHVSHAEHSPVDEEEEKAFRQQVATAFDAVARDANFQEDLRRRSAESSESPGGESPGGGDAESVTQPTPTRAELWRRAIKLPMYSVALAPLLVAGALCHHWYGCVNVPQWGALAGGACLVIAWLNLSNDAWDAATGVDDSKPESVVRLLGGDESEDARKAAVNKVHAIALGCLALGAGGLCYAATQLATNAAADVVYTVLAMLGAAVAAGHAYQGPPFRLSYKGMGEPLCFAAFGPLATGAFYLALAGGVPGGSVWMGVPATPTLLQPGVLGAAVLVGLTTTCILFTSHFHQEEGDRAAGKKSPVVRLGLRKAIDVLRGGVLFHHFLASFLAFNGWLPIMGAVGVFIAMPLSIGVSSFAARHADAPAELFRTKYGAVRWHVAHAVFLALGCWLDPWMVWNWHRIPGLAMGAPYV
ncbi:predicted protein [Micromonas commoda]|uniref:1,4-dihydroxy-2-naphthoate octaprenyltransferase n=1 Tax=Micromonas commoda (strain RCC299 / NOUM17 / CCMP2709) TaxID=296587 RepID=C1EFX4_MICCC|nr:predicted protein [Micromonas commoda]ACO66675.1 predicted protein [Micromonas commoda]|eukprot:XP_002505417.1 predicted protein [Micromonas commoda]